MLTDDLYGAISHMAETIDNAFRDDKDDNTSNSVSSLADSINNLAKTVSDDNKNAGGATTVIGLLAGVLTGDAKDLQEGSKELTNSVSVLASSMKAISDQSGDIVSSSEALSNAMQNLSEGIESIGLRTVVSVYLAKIAFPAINAFTIGAVELFASIAKKEKDLKAADNGIAALEGSIKNIAKSALYAVAAGVLAIPAIVALVPLSLFTLASSAIFSLCTNLFDTKKMKNTANAIDNMAHGLAWLALSALITTIAAPLYLVALPALIPASLFILGVAGLNLLCSKLFEDKNTKSYHNAISNVAKGILWLGLAAAASILVAPIMIAALPFLLVDSLFVLAYGALIVTPVTKLVNSKGFKNFKKGTAAMALGTVLMGLTALAAALLAPVFLLGSLGMLAAGVFIGVAGKVYKQAAKRTKDFIKGTEGLLVMSLGLLGTAFLLSLTVKAAAPLMSLDALGTLAVMAALSYSGARLFQKIGKIGIKNIAQGAGATLLASGALLGTSVILGMAVKQGQDLVSFDALGEMAVIAALSYGGAKLMSSLSGSLAQVAQGAAAVMLVAGTVFGAAWCFNNAVKNCKDFIADPLGTLESLGALVLAVGTMGTAIAAAGFALPFIVPGAAAVTLVAGTVFAAAMAIKTASDAFSKSQESGAFEMDSDGNTPFSNTIKGVVASMTSATSDVKDIDKLGDAIKAIMPVSDFVQRLAVGVSEFSKIAMMKGEIADSTGKKMPFNLTTVGEGIAAVCGAVISGIGDAMKVFNFDESNLVEISSGGFLGIGATKLKIPKQIAAVQHLVPLADFVSSLASGVSEFSKLATQSGSITTVVDGKTIVRPFNLQDVGKGISSVIQALMEGISTGLDYLGSDGYIKVKSGGFLGLGADEIEVPKKLEALQRISPLCDFVSALAEVISSLGKDKSGNALTVDSASIRDIFTGLVNAVNVEDLGDTLEDNADGVSEMGKALKVFLGAGWNNLPKEDNLTSVQHIVTYFNDLTPANITNIKGVASTMGDMGKSLQSITNAGDGLDDASDAIKATVDSVNTLDIDRCKALSDLYANMAKAAEKKKDALNQLVKTIEDSAKSIVDALDEAGKLDKNEISSTNQNNKAASSTTNNWNKGSRVPQNNTVVPVSIPAAPAKQKVTVDLTINGTGGDSWIIKRKI